MGMLEGRQSRFTLWKVSWHTHLWQPKFLSKYTDLRLFETHVVHVIKPFSFVTVDEAKEARVFVTGNHFPV
jgi:hypothetical protein